MQFYAWQPPPDNPEPRLEVRRSISRLNLDNIIINLTLTSRKSGKKEYGSKQIKRDFLLSYKQPILINTCI